MKARFPDKAITCSAVNGCQMKDPGSCGEVIGVHGRLATRRDGLQFPVSSERNQGQPLPRGFPHDPGSTTIFLILTVNFQGNSQRNISVKKYLNLPYWHYKYYQMPPKKTPFWAETNQMQREWQSPSYLRLKSRHRLGLRSTCKTSSLQRSM